MECSVGDGMTLVPSNDRTSHIRYSISLTYDFDSNIVLDNSQIHVENHRFPAAGSMTELSEQHPIRITVSGPSIVGKEYVPWHIQELEITMDLEVVEADGEKLSPKSILSSPIVIAVVLVGIFVIGFVAQRLYDRMSQSDYDIVLDDDDEDLIDDEEDEPYFEEETLDDEVEYETVSKPERRTRPRRRSVEKTSKRVPVQSKEAAQAKELLQKSSNEVVRKRRARRSEHDTVTTKRRKLSDTQTIDAKPRKRRAVKRAASTDDDMDETLKRFVSDSPEE